ncbi:MAG: P-loop NTPase fold protein [Planctomycetota bacterium]
MASPDRVSAVLRRVRVVLPRVLAVLCRVVIYALLCFTALPFVRAWPVDVHAFVGRWGDEAQGVARFVAVTAFWYAAAKYFDFRPRQILQVGTRVPNWLLFGLAVAIVAVVDLAGWYGEAATWSDTWKTWGRFRGEPETGIYVATGLDWLAFGLGPLIAALVIRRPSFKEPEQKIALDYRRERERAADAADSNAGETAEAADTADNESDEDWNDAGPLADRLADTLRARADSIGLIGPYGSGKTFVVEKLVERLKEFDKAAKKHGGTRFTISYHECWGFTTARAAVDAILEDILDRLADHVDVSDFRRLPAWTRGFFDGVASPLSFAINLLGFDSDPLDRLSDLDEIMRRLDRIIIVIVEDLDRNNGREFNAQDLIGFLDRFRDLRQITFVLTGGVKSVPAETFVRLCNTTDLMLPVAAAQVEKIVEEEIARAEPEGPFLCRSPLIRYAHNDRQSLIRQRLAYMRVGQGRYVAYGQVISALVTPRLLISIQREFRSAWSRLVGEVDAASLFSITVLRVATPDVFEFLVRELEMIVGDQNSGDRLRLVGESSVSNTPSATAKSWAQATHSNEGIARSAAALICELFPGSDKTLGIDFSVPGSSGGSTQRVNSPRYFRRAVRGYVSDAETRDQDVIRPANRWLRDCQNTENYIHRLATEDEYARLWCLHCASAYTDHYRERPGEWRLLADPVLAELSKHRDVVGRSSVVFGALASPIKYLANSIAPAIEVGGAVGMTERKRDGFVMPADLAWVESTAIMFLARPRNGIAVAAAVVDELGLPLAQMCSYLDGVSLDKSRESLALVRERVIAAICERSDAGELLSAVHADDRYSLNRLLIGNHAIPDGPRPANDVLKELGLLLLGLIKSGNETSIELAELFRYAFGERSSFLFDAVFQDDAPRASSLVSEHFERTHRRDT